MKKIFANPFTYVWAVMFLLPAQAVGMMLISRLEVSFWITAVGKAAGPYPFAHHEVLATAYIYTNVWLISMFLNIGLLFIASTLRTREKTLLSRQFKAFVEA